MRQEQFTKIKRFLTDLTRSQNGTAMVANIVGAIDAGHVPLDQCRKFLDTCTAAYSEQDNNGQAAYSVFADVVHDQYGDIFFNRTLEAVPECKILVVMRIGTLMPDHWIAGEWTIFEPVFFQQRRLQGDRARPVSTGDQVKAAIATLKRGFERFLKPDAKLGGNEFVVFVTRHDDGWRQRIEGLSPKSRADFVRSHLGLPHGNGEILVELKLHVGLSELPRNGIKIAGPTFLEAWRCELFRQVPETRVQDGWGRTVDLAKLKQLDTNTDGAPEMILSSLPLATFLPHLEISEIGLVNQDQPAGLAEHVSRLLGRRTSQGLINSIMLSCYSSQASRRSKRRSRRKP